MRYEEGKKALTWKEFNFEKAVAARDKRYPIEIVQELIRRSDVVRRHIAENDEEAKDRAKIRAKTELRKNIKPIASMLVCSENQLANWLKMIMDMHSVTLEMGRVGVEQKLEYQFTETIGTLHISDGYWTEKKDCIGFDIVLKKDAKDIWHLVHCRPLQQFKRF